MPIKISYACFSVGVGFLKAIIHILAGVSDFKFLKITHKFLGFYPYSSSMRTVGSFPGIEWRKCEADHSAQSANSLRISGAVPLLMPLWFVW